MKRLSFEKQREKRSVSNPRREERENIPLLRAGRGLQGPWCGGSSPVLLLGAEESFGQEKREILFAGIHLGGLGGAAGSCLLWCRAGEMLRAHPRLAQSLQGSSAGALRGRDSHRFSFPFSPWPRDWRRLERGSAAPSEEGCVSPGQGSQALLQSWISFPGDMELCSWPDWL